MPTEITIAGRRIGRGAPIYVIAELSANHNQNFEQAVRIVHAARDAGADAVKLQTYTADTITLRSDKECFRIAGGTLWDGRTLHDLYREAFTPWEWQPKLKQIANELGMHLFSSAFDDSAVDFLEQMSVPAHKVASFELVDIGLIQRMARTGKPLIMSTGMASEVEIDEAVQAARTGGSHPNCFAEVYKRVSGTARGGQSAHNTRTGPTLPLSRWVVGSHDGNRSRRCRRRFGSIHH